MNFCNRISLQPTFSDDMHKELPCSVCYCPEERRKLDCSNNDEFSDFDSSYDGIWQPSPPISESEDSNDS